MGPVKSDNVILKFLGIITKYELIGLVVGSNLAKNELTLFLPNFLLA